MSLRRPAVMSHHQSSRHASGGKETDVVSFLVDSDNKQDGVEPANGPSTTPDDRIKAVQAELEA